MARSRELPPNLPRNFYLETDETLSRPQILFISCRPFKKSTYDDLEPPSSYSCFFE